MCDFVSWIEKTVRGKGTKYYYLTDDIIVSKWGEEAKDIRYMESYIGHDAIRRYFGSKEVGGRCEYESFEKIPLIIAAEVNAGKMRLMALAWDEEFINPKYDVEGNLISVNGISKADITVPIHPYKDQDSFKVGDIVVFGEHALANMFRESGSSFWWKSNPKGIRKYEWSSALDYRVGRVFEIKKIYEKDGIKYIPFPETSQYFADEGHLGACRYATPEEIERYKKAKKRLTVTF